MLQFHVTMFFHSCRRFSGCLIMQTVQVFRISPKCSSFKLAVEVSAPVRAGVGLTCVHKHSSSYTACAQLSSLLLSGVSGTHIHLPALLLLLPPSVSASHSAWHVVSESQTLQYDGKGEGEPFVIIPMSCM